MADSACLMHAFSYASAVPNEAKQGNPMHALGESISFGRFMSESLAWEKWSTFSHNKYVEEAERYARPGSVAQKKAFFEAHYKRIAAKKAAALLEQANDSGENAHGGGGGEVVENILHHDINSKEDPPIINADDEHSSVTVAGDEDCKPETEQVGEVNLKAETKALPRVETPAAAVVDLSKRNRHEAQETASGSELSETPQMERPLLKNSSSTKEEDEDEVSSAPPIKKRSALSSLKSSIHGKTSSRIPSTPAMPYTYPHLNKENIITPIPLAPPIMKSYGAVSVGVMKPTSKSLSSLLNLTPAKDNPDIAPPLAKETSQVAPITTKAAKNCPTPLMTPTATSNGLSKLYSATPASGNGRTKTPSGSKTSGPKWHLLTSVCSKSLTACRNKLQSPTLSTTPFRLRTEERAARRKQKLEEKFNAKEEEVQKVQLQTKLKEKAGTELRKLGRSLCFKARPLPDFYKERETTKNQSAKENPVIHPQPLKLGKKTSSSRMPGTVPSQSNAAATSLTKSSGAFKNAAKTNDKRPTTTVSVTSPQSLA